MNFTMVKRLWYKLTFDASHEYGMSLTWQDEYSNLGPYSAWARVLHEDAQLRLPKGLYYELRGQIPTDFGRDKAIAWYHKPGMWRQNNVQVGEFRSGYFYLGGFLT